MESSYEGGLCILFPTFKTNAIIGHHNIYLDAQPIYCSDKPEGSFPSPTEVFRDITDFQQNRQVETDCLDNILSDLRQYFNEVKTKRQLGPDVPAGFRHSSDHQRQYLLQTPPRKSKSSLDFTSFSSLGEITSDSTAPTPIRSNCSSETEPFPPSQHIDLPCQDVVPIVRSVDKASSSLPQHITMNEDHLFIRNGIYFKLNINFSAET